MAWGRGSSFPYPTSADLTDAVVGRRAEPDPSACYVVAGLLGTAAAAVAGVPARDHAVRRVAVLGVVTALATRGAFGLAGRTDLLVAGSTSARFRRNDRRVFSPLCIALAAGAAVSLRA